MRAEYPITYYHMITVAVKRKVEKFNWTWNQRTVRTAKPLKRQLLGGAGRRESVFQAAKANLRNPCGKSDLCCFRGQSPIEDKPLPSEPKLRPPKDPEMQQGM